VDIWRPVNLSRPRITARVTDGAARLRSCLSRLLTQRRKLRSRVIDFCRPEVFDSLPKTPDEFYSIILAAAIGSLKHNNYRDNFDAEILNWDGVDHSLEFNTAQHVFFFQWFFTNHLQLYDAYRCLRNDSSKRLYLYLIAYRLAGHQCVKIPVDFVARKTEYEKYKAVERYSDSRLPLTGMFGKLKHFDFEYDGKRYVADCLNLEYYLFRRQYFYSQDGVDISPQNGNTVIDGGTCTGETALVFSNAVGAKGNVYAFDPVAEHLDVLSFNIRRFPYPNVKVMPFGLSDKDVDCDPVMAHSYDPAFRSDDHNVPLRSIDGLVERKEIERIDFVKLDIEGAELAALNGAKSSILEFKPKLAVSLYHRPNDIFEIVHYVRTQFPFYSLYIGHYTIHYGETVLYCIAQ
jgi:FkbM family methyltransferase